MTNPDAIHLPISRHSDETQIVDLAKTIREFSRVSGQPIGKARAEVIHFIGMSPLNVQRRIPGSRPTFEMLDDDRFSITAQPVFFKSLNSICKSLEAGKKQVLIECRIFQANKKQLKFLNQILEQNKAPHLAIQNSRQFNELESNPQKQFVRSSTVILERHPCFSRPVSPENLSKLVKFLSNAKCRTLHAPRVICYPEGLAKIEDAQQKSFLTQAQQVGDLSWHPEIEFLKDGIVFEHIPYIQNNGNIRLNSKITKLTVQESRTVSYESERTDLHLQSPSQKQETVELNMEIADGGGLLIDPNFRTETSRSKKDGVKKLYLITAKILSMSRTPK